MSTPAPYGSWLSPITLDVLVERAVVVSFPLASATCTYWMEMRPADGARQVIVRRRDDRSEDVFGPDFHARTLAHEYGGLCYALSGDTVYFSNLADQRLYRVSPGDEPQPITPEPPSPRSIRYAAPVVTGDGRHLIAVRECHFEPDEPSNVRNDLVVVATDGSAEVRVLAEGHDFYSHPTLSPDGKRLAWTSWDHPNMPWDGAELFEADIVTDGSSMSIRSGRLIAGGPAESVTQPKYSPTGVLHFASDRTGWWNLYCAASEEGGTRDGAGEDRAAAPIVAMDAELAGPDWAFGMSSYTFLTDGSIVATWSGDGRDHLGLLRPGATTFEEITTAFTSFASLRQSSDATGALAIAGGPTTPSSVVQITPAASSASTSDAEVEVLRTSRTSSLDAQLFSMPEPIEFPTEDGLTAYGLYYPPHNPRYEAPEGELPPLVVDCHGGPTGAVSSVLDYGVQFWTSRGFAVVKVDYGGSAGHGRAYRERLTAKWGIVDLDDCVNAAGYLVATNRADGDRLVVRGGSAGGYTTFCAVTFRDVFAAGASYFGLTETGVFVEQTHKFESRYIERLIGPWPEAEALHRERSPLLHVDQISTPIIIFQGLEDKVVPPNQAEMIVEALRDSGLPHAYVAYEGEQHGFRKAENQRRTAEAELYFYSRVLGFTPADSLEPVEIVGEENLRGG